MGSNVASGRTRLSPTSKDPTELGFKCEWRVRRSNLPALQQYLHEHVHTENDVDLTRVSETWISQWDVRQVIPRQVEGNRVEWQVTRHQWDHNSGHTDPLPGEFTAETLNVAMDCVREL